MDLYYGINLGLECTADLYLHISLRVQHGRRREGVEGRAITCFMLSFLPSLFFVTSTSISVLSDGA